MGTLQVQKYPLSEVSTFPELQVTHNGPHDRLLNQLNIYSQHNCKGGTIQSPGGGGGGLDYLSAHNLNTAWWRADNFKFD